jgi:hypothetical protein
VNSVREIRIEYKNFWPQAALRKLVDPVKDTTQLTPGTGIAASYARNVSHSL